ncbi:BgTH12-07198 [Blumeria graminis f. sp. triticale]|uniref:Crh-like protein n=3 Tax=Blumeria graminis TaxID=34373 RepID=A0A061HLM5_BLUGR|nr:chitin transglycosidase cell wall protein [Blumeria graminis f. sp. tritici 96224]CAD6506271.1 BgTH12-07198 [Blumeria graminis f. sp. triticale]VDB95028.1 Bgt-1257 [Blumeria graminis f. sp. tritici]
MRFSDISVPATVFLILNQAYAQTSTDCNPLQKTCPPNPGLGTSVFTDFTKGKSDYWQPLQGTTMKYDGPNGAQFTIQKSSDAPTMSLTKFIMFGHIDMIAKASPGTGIVSSFVLLSKDLDEIDWEWLGGINSNVQTNFFGKGDVSSYDRGTTVAVQTPVDSFHTYSLDWTAERIVWTIDGQTVRTLAYADAVAKSGKNYPQTPMEVKMGSWIGCLDYSNPETKGTCEWAGGQADLTKAPFTMSVKSVNVTDYGCGGEYTYSDNSGSWQSIKSSGACDGKGTGPGAPNSAEAPDDSIVPIAGAVAPVNPNKASGPSGSLTPDDGPAASPNTKGTLSKGTPSNGTSSNGTTPNSTNTPGTAISTGVAKPPPAVSSGVPNINTSDANKKSKRSYGPMEFTVIALGLGLGYFVM